MSTQQTTEAIVLKTIKYSDTSLIIKTFTSDFGIQTYLAKGIKNKKSRNKANLFQPLNILNITSTSSKSDLQFLKEVTSAYPYNDIPYNVLKGSIVFFINEFLYKTFLADDFTDNQLYNFIKSTLILLDNTRDSVANFHLFFMAHFTHFMGIFPNNIEDGRFFDLTGGVFSHRAETPFLDTKTSELFKQILNLPLAESHTLKIPTYDKNNLLQGMLDYYRIHLDGFKEMESYKVLKTVLSD